MATQTKKLGKTQKQTLETGKVKKLSKVGEWLMNGRSIGGTYEMRAILR
jgi:hypothetical protein